MLLNRILDDQAREEYKNAIQKLWDTSPEMMARKIDRANVQQAFALDTIEKLYKDGNMIAAGCFEDTTYDALVKLGYPVVGVDPIINCTLEEFYRSNPDERFSMGFSVSVLEHVLDDETYLHALCQMTTDYIVLTFDYNPDWDRSKPMPTTCVRQYCYNDLSRLINILQQEGFEIYGQTDYSGKIDFSWEGCEYAFGTLVAKRL